jgi:hypothetical protein
VYKRQVQWVTLGLAVLGVVLLGVDSISIAKSLSQEQGIRAAVTGAAQHASSTALKEAVNTLSAFALPIGWSVQPQSAGAWAMKAVGLAITVLAVSLGAPFWFDLLNKLANLRASGPKPQPSVQTADKS